MNSPAVYVGNDANVVAARKSRYGRRSWLLWIDGNKQKHTAVRTPETMKLAMLASGTQGLFWCYEGGISELYTWCMGSIYLRNAKVGYL